MSATEDRSRSETLTANERVKALSGAVMNLAIVLLVAAIARIYLRPYTDVAAILWILGAILLMLIALKLLALLDAEDLR